MEYTKGEWLNHEVLIESKVMKNAYKSIALIIPTGNNEEMKANAYLIAAAPIMYELLKVCRWAIENRNIPMGINYRQLLKDINKTLAKAEGKKKL